MDSLPYPHGLPLLAGLVFHDVACNRARRHGQRAGEIHLSRTATAWEVTILGADHDLIRPRRDSGSGINAGAAAWLNHMRAGVLENIDIALAYTVIARFLRSKLDIELHRVRDAFALTQGVGQNARIHIHIFILSGSARAPIGNLHRHRRIQLADVLTIPRIARRCHHGCDLGSIQLDHLSVLRVIVAAQALNQRFRLFAIHAATLNQKFDNLLVRSNDPGEPADLSRHIRHRSALIHAEFFNGLARILHDFRQCLAAAHVIETEYLQNEIFRGHVRMLLAPDDDLDRLWHANAHVFRDPGVENVSCADPERHASYRAYVRGVRIRADVQLSRQGIALEDNRVADSFRTLAVLQLAMQLDSLPLREIFLLELELRGQIKQAELFLFFGYDFIQERQVVAEEKDRRRIVYFGIFAHVVLEEDRRHRSDVFMAEAQVSPGKAGITGFHCCDAHVAILIQHVARKDCLGQRHRPCGAGTLARSFDRRQKNFLLHARNVEREKSTVLDHLASNLIFTERELAQRNFFSGANLIDQRKIGRSQHAEVLAILLVDAFDVLRDHQFDACRHLCIGRLLAARAFAPPLAADRANESATLYIAAANGKHAASLQPRVRNLAESLVEIEAVVRRSDLVSRNVVTQLRIVRGIFRVPRQILARKLTFDQLRIFRQKKNSPLQPNFVRPLFDFPFQK